MKLETRLSLFFCFMLALTISGALLSVWSSRQAAFYLKRLDLATQVYSANLKLSSHTYQLFKQFGDVLIVGRRDNGARKEELISLIRADIAVVRDLIGQEIDLVGENEIEELAALSALELQIETIFTELLSITRGDFSGDDASNWEKLSTILESEIDLDFQERIEAALAEEAEEVAETRASADRMLSLMRNLSALFGGLAFLGSVGSFLALRRFLEKRMTALSGGAMRMSNGDLAHRIKTDGDDELTALARTLNELAEKVGQREATLRSVNEDLEQTVRDRTIQLEKLLEDVRYAEANRKRLMADVSHELRTPLTVIRGEADIALRGEKEPEAYRDALNVVRDAAAHTSRLVDDLLFVARHEAGETRLRINKRDIVPMIEALAGASSRNAQVVTDLNSASLQCDEGRIRQALLILLENARQYGGSDIVIRLDPAPDGYRIAVEDNGPGMTDADKQNAFQRFFRGSNAAERYGDGAGLGLPVAKSIIEAHGGKIDLVDRDGGGLSAVIMLPTRASLRAVS